MDTLQYTLPIITSFDEKTSAISQLEKGQKGCINISLNIKNRAKTSR